MCEWLHHGWLPGTWMTPLTRIFFFQVSVLACPDPVVHEIAYQYGKNVGIAFQVGVLVCGNGDTWARPAFFSVWSVQNSEDSGSSVGVLIFPFAAHR